MDNQMKIKIEINAAPNAEHDHDEIWQGKITVNKAIYSYYAYTDVILINGVCHDWPKSIGSVNSAIAYVAINQFHDMLES